MLFCSKSFRGNVLLIITDKNPCKNAKCFQITLKTMALPIYIEHDIKFQEN